jgi:predicted nucleic acid-binding protein
MLLSRIGNGLLQILPLTMADVMAVASILDTYDDQGFDFADACLMHLANREGIEHVFTIDRRHFSVFRPERGPALTLHPA